MSPHPRRHRLRPQRAPSRKCQQAPGDRRSPLGCLFCHVSKLHRVGINRATLDEVQTADYRLQNVVEVVRNASGELAQCFHSLQLREPGFGQLPLMSLLREAVVGSS